MRDKMRLGICTIQRDRGRWLKEWVTFHHLIGFKKFYIFLHRCTDNSAEVILELKKYFDIQCFVLGEELLRPQLVAYQYAYQNFGDEIDWMAFIDGDEFLFPTSSNNICEVMERFEYEKISAVGAWWACYGSNGHMREPDGLIIENYTRRAEFDLPDNSHFKSIVRGRQGSNFSIGANAHFFNTLHGTVDEHFNPLTFGHMPGTKTSYDFLRINHYVCQSYEFFKTFKQHSGAADAGANVVRPDEKWHALDRNDVFDDKIHKFLPALQEKLSIMKNK